jgi:hypothetical protein
MLFIDVAFFAFVRGFRSDRSSAKGVAVILGRGFVVLGNMGGFVPVPECFPAAGLEQRTQRQNRLAAGSRPTHSAAVKTALHHTLARRSLLRW